MERELTLATLALSACGSALLVAGSLVPAAGPARRSGCELEHVSASRVWQPLVLAAFVFAVLLGWGLQEPDITSEALSPVLQGAALAVAAIWIRAAARAAFSLVVAGRRRADAAHTVGLLRPRVVIGPQLASRLDALELRAVVAHEQAHVHHRDPLRILMAQLVTDLQWPMPAARGRLQAWRRALELARDEEARACGVEGVDLASAIVKAARQSRPGPAATPALVDGLQLVDRVGRLLGPTPPSRERASSFRPPVLLAVSLSVAVILGQVWGESVVLALGGVQR